MVIHILLHSAHIKFGQAVTLFNGFRWLSDVLTLPACMQVVITAVACLLLLLPRRHCRWGNDCEQVQHGMHAATAINRAAGRLRAHNLAQLQLVDGRLHGDLEARRALPAVPLRR